MSSETKVIFDQLTEDAMKLMENGEYDVYHEKKEIFEHESDDDEQTTANPPSAERNLVSGAPSLGIDQPLSNTDSNSESGALGSDYVYDESSRYYYSGSLDYYYDPSTGLYCSAVSGQWKTNEILTPVYFYTGAG